MGLWCRLHNRAALSRCADWAYEPGTDEDEHDD